jgi:type II secretory pathway pseudopilin PulG
LLELLTVIVIISILSALILAVVARVRQKARRTQVLNFIKDVENSAKVFQLAYNRWPWDSGGAGLNQKLAAAEVFAELAPGNTALAPATHDPLVNRERAEYLTIAPTWIRNGRVVDLWENELEFFWNPDMRGIVIVSPGPDHVNQTIDVSGTGSVRPPAQQGDDINNL